MDKTKLKKEQVFIRVKDNPELLRKVEQLLKDAGETVYRNTTEGILEYGWEFLAMDCEGEWVGTSYWFVDPRSLTEVNLKELTLILGGIWDESLDPETGECIVSDEPDGNEAEGVTEDKVNHPSHYTNGNIECIDAIEEATKHLTGIEAVCTANAIKYLWRWKLKNGTEDLKKAKWYIDRLLKVNVHTAF